MGQIVVLNGPSSAGKTTLALAVRDRLAPKAAAVSIDHFFALVHPSHRDDWKLFATLTEAMLATAVAFANGGLRVIVDTVFERPASLEAARRILAPHTYFLVAVTCPVAVLEERERQRGDRRIGQARDQHERVLQGATYDLHLDTKALSVDACVERVVQLLG